MRPTVTTSFQIMDLDSILHTAASETPPRISTCLIFFSAIRPLFHSLLSLSLSALIQCDEIERDSRGRGLPNLWH